MCTCRCGYRYRCCCMVYDNHGDIQLDMVESFWIRDHRVPAVYFMFVCRGDSASINAGGAGKKCRRKESRLVKVDTIARVITNATQSP